GPMWIGGTGFGASSATETMPGGSRFALFMTTTELGSALGFEARVGVRMTDSIDVGVEGSYSAPTLRTTISSDAENGTPNTATVDVDQIMIGGWVGVRLTGLRLWRQGVPFVEAGAGYLRQLYDTGQLAVSGQTFHVGGGSVFPLVPKKNKRPAGALRLPARAGGPRDGGAPPRGTPRPPRPGGARCFPVLSVP